MRISCVCIALLGLACACASSPPPASSRGPATVVATPLNNEIPPASDAVPMYALAFEYPDGTRVPIAEPASAYAPFRDGVALIDGKRRLLLISPDGSARPLAASTATTPVPGPSGELYYVALYGEVAELHRLTVAGRDRVIARETSSVGLIAPRADDGVLFVGARNGGVAGIWHVAKGASHASCMTNCELKTGAPWGDAFVPPPGTREELEAQYRARVTPTFEGEDGVLRGEP
jgi:hypothetical protein